MDLITFPNNGPNIFVLKCNHWAFSILKAQLKLAVPLNYKCDEVQNCEQCQPRLYTEGSVRKGPGKNLVDQIGEKNLGDRSTQAENLRKVKLTLIYHLLCVRHCIEHIINRKMANRSNIPLKGARNRKSRIGERATLK